MSGKVRCFERDMEPNWEICEYMGANETFNTTSTPGHKHGSFTKGDRR